jgi:alkanesulfonate monooxygenase SsuD/methylene tetrahydromethanopterin reductase-like flavin-dependent oxidoreductase (luciferase family)
LTHLIGQDIDSLAAKIHLYRESLEKSNWGSSYGKVSLMLHTFLDHDIESVRAKVRTPFREYLRSAVSLEKQAAMGGGAISGGHKMRPIDCPGQAMEDLLDITFERYFQTAALMGTPSSCMDIIWRLKEVGVDEIACLIDFLDDTDAILRSLTYLNELRASVSSSEDTTQDISTFLEDLEAENSDFD